MAADNKTDTPLQAVEDGTKALQSILVKKQHLLQDSYPWLEKEILGTPVLSLLLVPVALLAAWLLASLLTGMMTRLLHLFARATGVKKLEAFVAPQVPPMRLLLAVGLFRLLRHVFVIDKVTSKAMGVGELLVTVYAVTWVFFNLTDYALTRLQKVLSKQQKQGARAVLPLLSRLAKMAIVILALLFLLQNLGYDVATIIAGLGIGGIAIALASQKSLENLLGGATLVLDQPVRVGDFCRFGNGMMGTVEDIGLRSSRIRSLERTLITIPNAEFAGMMLENVEARDRILFKTVLTLRYETTSSQLEAIIGTIDALLLKDTRIYKEEKPRVRLVELAASSINIEVFCYIATRDNEEYLAIRETLLLTFMEIIENAGAAFAFPSQALYLKKG